MPQTVAQASQLFPATEAPFTGKNAMFRANLNIQIASLIRENEAFVRGILPIPRVEALNASLQCSSSNAQSVSTHAKHNSTASSKKRKSHLEPSVHPLALGCPSMNLGVHGGDRTRQELYVSFNDIKDLSPLLAHEASKLAVQLVGFSP